MVGFSVGGRPGAGELALAVDVGVAGVELLDVVGGDVVGHHGGLDGGGGARADGEDAVVLEQHGGRGADVGDDLLADLLAADQGEAGAGDGAAELVGDGGEVDGDGLAEGGEGGGVG